jgi:hypothetical protein
MAGALDRYQAEMHVTAWLPEQFALRRLALESLHELLGEAGYAAASGEGSTLSFDELVALALAEPDGVVAGESRGPDDNA